MRGLLGLRHLRLQVRPHHHTTLLLVWVCTPHRWSGCQGCQHSSDSWGHLVGRKGWAAARSPYPLGHAHSKLGLCCATEPSWRASSSRAVRGKPEAAEEQLREEWGRFRRRSRSPEAPRVSDIEATWRIQAYYCCTRMSGADEGLIRALISPSKKGCMRLYARGGCRPLALILETFASAGPYVLVS